MIKFSNIDLAYNGKPVFNDLSLEVKTGEKVVFLGKSGSGKSSLFYLLLGFVPAGSGQIFFDGVTVDEDTVWDVRSKVAYVDQDVSVGDGRVSDWIDFVSGLKINRSNGFEKDKVRELLDTFELDDDVLAKDVIELSGGERQRLAIIVAVLLGRKVFLLDEVTSSLDKHLKEKVAGFFLGRDDWTVIVISHDHVWLDDPSVRIFDLGGGRWKQ